MKELLARRAELKKKLLKRERILAAWTSIAHPSITEIFCKADFDFVGIDIEHSTISQEQSQRIIAASQAHGSLCLPRIATHNEEMTKRLLDSGADGIIVPMVENQQQVEEIVKWVKYPPQGRRSFGVARAQGYGFDFDEYTKKWNDASTIIVQIESMEGVNNIDAILTHKDVDGVMVGPYDISGSLGIPGQLEHADVKKASKKIIQACEKYGKSCGTQNIDPDKDNIKKAFSEGYTFVVLASDIFILWKWTERITSFIKQVR